MPTSPSSPKVRRLSLFFHLTPSLAASLKALRQRHPAPHAEDYDPPPSEAEPSESLRTDDPPGPDDDLDDVPHHRDDDVHDVVVGSLRDAPETITEK